MSDGITAMFDRIREERLNLEEKDKNKLPLQYPWGKPPKKHYVYVHKNALGHVFYVGKGKKRRAWDASKRSKQWFELAKDGFIVEIIQEGLEKKSAFELEYNHIKICIKAGCKLANINV